MGPLSLTAPSATQLTATNTLTSGTYNIVNDPYDLKEVGNQLLFLGDKPDVNAHMGGPGRTGDFAPPKKSGGISTATASQFMTGFAQESVTNPQAFANQQIELYNAGMYNGSKPRLGVYTPADATAMKYAFTGYIGVFNPKSPNPVSFATYLAHAQAQMKANGGVGGGGGAGGGRAPLSLTDPAELEQTLQSAAQQDLGRNLSKAEVGVFVKAFHGKERSAYNSAGAGGTYTSPSVSGQALDEVDAGHSAEEGQKLTASYMDEISSMLGVK